MQSQKVYESFSGQNWEHVDTEKPLGDHIAKEGDLAMGRYASAAFLSMTYCFRTWSSRDVELLAEDGVEMSSTRCKMD